jgi:hypothetical protein
LKEAKVLNQERKGGGGKKTFKLLWMDGKESEDLISPNRQMPITNPEL